MSRKHAFAAAVWLAAALFLVSGCGDAGEEQRPEAAADIGGGRGSGAPAAEVETVLFIQGMRCAACATLLEEALSQTAGVTRVSVDLTSGRAVVAGRNLDPDELARAVEAKGYSVSAAPRDGG